MTKLNATCAAFARLGQKAPSAKRCIKTLFHTDSMAERMPVRKHRAPKGALRP